MVKTKLDTMCRTRKQQSDLVPTNKLINFGIKLLNYKGTEKGDIMIGGWHIKNCHGNKCFKNGMLPQQVKQIEMNLRIVKLSKIK